MEKSQEQLEAEMIEKAIAVEDMVNNHPGWKHLVEIVESICNREREALSGQPLDNSYYKRIGFIQMYKYCSEIPGVLKDKAVRNYLLSQGKFLGAKTFLNAPKMFIEGIMKGHEQRKAFRDEGNLKLQAEEKSKFNHSQLK